MIIIVDEPTVGSKYGSVVAAPYVSNLLELILPYLGIEAEYSTDDYRHETVSVPNFVGMTVDDAVTSMKNEKIEFEVVGSGDVVYSQMPMAGGEIYKHNGKVILYTGENSVQTVEMPNVIGKTAEEANKIITNSGLNIKIEGANNFKYGQGAYIVYQSYSPGEILLKGTIVTVKILYSEEKD